MYMRRALLLALVVVGCKKETPPTAASQASGEPPAGPATPPPAPAGSGSALPSGSGSGSDMTTGSGSSGSGSATATGTGSGGAAGATRTVGPFTEVHIGNALEADIDIGPAAPLTLTGDPSVVAVVVTDVSGNVLDIHLPSGTHEMKERVKVHVTVPSLTAVEAGTSATVVGNGIAEDKLRVKASTSADVTLKGTCKSLDATAETSGKLDASGLVCETVTITAATAGDARVNATGAVTGSASTASHVHIAGNPGQKAVKTSTAGTVD